MRWFKLRSDTLPSTEKVLNRKEKLKEIKLPASQPASQEVSEKLVKLDLRKTKEEEKDIPHRQKNMSKS